jgi:membrane protein insertase Oxa1/YidC/SpoIIIJ
MAEDGFNINKVNDTIREAKNFYDNQVSLMEKQKNSDFSKVLAYCEKIIQIQEDALKASYELASLLKFYNISLSSRMNTSTADLIILEINNEIRDERYENVPALIDNAYSEISKIQASQTTLGIFYKSTTRNIRTFLYKNWKWLSILIVVLIILYLVFKKRIMIYFIKKKMYYLEIRKNTLKELVMQTQKGYFQDNKISEGTYAIKTKKYAELIRDIDRQIPLLKEEIASLGSRK